MTAAALIPDTVRSSLQPLRKSMEQGEYKDTVDKVREYFEVCAWLAKLVGEVPQMNRALMVQGVSGKKLIFVLCEEKDAIERAIEIFEKVQEASTSTSFADRDTKLRQLREDIEAVKSVRAGIDNTLHWLETSRPRLDPRTLEESPEPTDYAKAEDVLARLQAGGNL